MQHSDDARGARLLDHRASILFRFARVHDDGPAGVSRYGQLARKGSALEIPRRVVVVVVEAALPDGHGPRLHEVRDPARIGNGVPAGRVMRMDAGRETDEVRMQVGQALCACRGLDRLSNTHDAERAGQAGALDHVLLIGRERRVGEVSVRVDEPRHETQNRRERRGGSDGFSGFRRPPCFAPGAGETWCLTRLA